MNWSYPKPGDYTQFFIPVCFAPSSEWSIRTQAALDDLELEEDDRSYEGRATVAMALERAQWQEAPRVFGTMGRLLSG